MYFLCDIHVYVYVFMHEVVFFIALSFSLSPSLSLPVSVCLSVSIPTRILEITLSTVQSSAGACVPDKVFADGTIKKNTMASKKKDDVGAQSEEQISTVETTTATKKAEKKVSRDSISPSSSAKLNPDVQAFQFNL